MLCLSGFELYSHWVPLKLPFEGVLPTRGNIDSEELRTITLTITHYVLLILSEFKLFAKVKCWMHAQDTCPKGIT